MENMPPETSSAPGRSEARAAPGGLVSDKDDGPDDRHGGEDVVDVEAPAPGQILGQKPPEHEPDRAPGAGDGAVDPEGLPAVTRVGEGGGEKG